MSSEKKVDCCFEGQGHSKGSKYQWVFVWTISSIPINHFVWKLVWWSIMMSQSVMQKKNGLLSSRLQQVLIWSKQDFFLYIFRTADFFATKVVGFFFWFFFVLHYYFLWGKKKIAVFMVKITGNLQNVAECLSGWYFLNCLSPSLVWCCIILSQSIMWKGWVAFFKVKVTMKAYIIKIWLSTTSSQLLIPLQPTFGLIANHYKLGCLVNKIVLLCCAQGQGQSNGSKFQWIFIMTISSQMLNLLWP